MREMSASASAHRLVAFSAGKQHRELVAGEARQDVGRAEPAAHRLGDAPKRDVPGAVAARVVHGLQAVHVDQEQRADPAVAAAEREL